MNKVVKVIEIKSGKIKYAVYAHNSTGSLRYNIDGKFYTDKQFYKSFRIIKIN